MKFYTERDLRYTADKDGAVTVSREGTEYTLRLAQDQYRRFQACRKRGGPHIQNALPELSAEQREFLISGVTPEEWAELFPEGGDS